MPAHNEYIQDLVRSFNPLLHCSDCKLLFPRDELRSASAYKNSRKACATCYARIQSYRRKPLAT